MSPQEQKYYNETILPRLEQLKLSPNSSYGLQVSDMMLARYRQSQKNQQRVQQTGTNLKPQMLDEVTVTAPKLIAKTTDNSDTTPLTKGTSWTSELDNETKTALGNGVSYDANKARSGEREAQSFANKVGLGLGAIGLSIAAAPVIGTLIGEGLKVVPMFLNAMWNPGNYLSYLGPNATKAAPYLNAITHSAGYTGAASNLYSQVTKDRSNQTVLGNAKDGALAALDLSLLGHGYSKVHPYTKAAYNVGKAAIENASVYFQQNRPISRLVENVKNYNISNILRNHNIHLGNWYLKPPVNKNTVYRIMSQPEAEDLLAGHSIRLGATNPQKAIYDENFKKSSPFNLIKIGAEHGGVKQFSKGMPWTGTTVTNGDKYFLQMKGKGLPWITGRHYRINGAKSKGLPIQFEDAYMGAHINLVADPVTKTTGIFPGEGSYIYKPLRVGYKRIPIISKTPRDIKFKFEGTPENGLRITAYNKQYPELGMLDLQALDYNGVNGLGIEDVHNNAAYDGVKGISRLLYDRAIQYAKDNGYSGIISGRNLKYPEATLKVLKNYLSKKVIGNDGVYHYKNEPQVEQPVYLLDTQSSYKEGGKLSKLHKLIKKQI